MRILIFLISAALFLPGIAAEEERLFSFAVTGLAAEGPVERGAFAGRNGVGCNAAAAQGDAVLLRLGRTLPAGNYVLSGNRVAVRDGSAGLAVGGRSVSGRKVPIAVLAWADRAGYDGFSAYFRMEEPFDALLLEKAYASDRITRQLGDFTLRRSAGTHELRLANLAEAFRRPAPFGLRCDILRDKAEKAMAGGDAKAIDDCVAEIAEWLDRQAKAVDLLEYAGELRQAAAALAVETESRELLARLERHLQTAFAANDLLMVRGLLLRLERETLLLHQRLRTAAGGEVLAEFGTDIHAWVKNIELGEPRSNFDCQEPMPDRILFAGNLRFHTGEPGGRIDFISGPVESVYDSETATYYFTALTSVQLVGMKRPTLEWFFTLRQPELKTLSGTVAELTGDNGYSLLVIGSRPFRADAADGKVTLSAEPGTLLGLVSAAPGADRGALAAFYRPLLPRLPVSCVQLQRGNLVEQRFFDRSGNPAAFAPVSPLAVLSEPSPFPVKMTAPTTATPDGRRIVSGTHVLNCTLPERPRRQGIGVNLWNYPNLDEEIFASLERQGCPSIRLTLGVGEDVPRSADWDDPAVQEKLRAPLLRNLELAKKHRLKVGLDNHNIMPESNGKFGKALEDPRWRQEFLRRWSRVIGWSAPYRENLIWYDLWNEPGIDANPRYYDLLREVLPEMRKLDPVTPFLVEVTHGANAVGARYWQDTGDPDTILGFHLYQLLMFTHQRQPVGAGGAVSEDIVHYPGWQPLIPLNAPVWQNVQPWIFCDRFMAAGALYPVLERAVMTGLPLDCGEFGVIQSAKKSPLSGAIWLADVFRILDRIGASGMIWCRYPFGFVWPVPEFVAETLSRWNPREP